MEKVWPKQLRKEYIFNTKLRGGHIFSYLIFLCVTVARFLRSFLIVLKDLDKFTNGFTFTARHFMPPFELIGETRPSLARSISAISPGNDTGPRGSEWV